MGDQAPFLGDDLDQAPALLGKGVRQIRRQGRVHDRLAAGPEPGLEVAAKLIGQRLARLVGDHQEQLGLLDLGVDRLAVAHQALARGGRLGGLRRLVRTGRGPQLGQARVGFLELGRQGREGVGEMGLDRRDRGDTPTDLIVRERRRANPRRYVMQIRGRLVDGRDLDRIDGRGAGLGAGRQGERQEREDKQQRSQDFELPWGDNVRRRGPQPYTRATRRRQAPRQA